MFKTLLDVQVKETTYLQGVHLGHEFPVVMVRLSSVVYHGWECKCSKVLATSSYSKISVNKDMMMVVMMTIKV